MKQELILSEVQYIDLEHEGYLNNLKQQVTERGELQGKQDGTQNKPKTADGHRALILNYIEVTVQGCIDRNQQRYLPVSGVAIARHIEIQAGKKVHDLRNSINDDEHSLRDAKNEAERLKPDVKLIAIRKWVLAALVFIACAEGFFSYVPFRHASFPVLAAIVASIAVAFGVGLSSHHLGGWIKQAKAWPQTAARYAVVLTLAIVGFSYLAMLRANAYNHKFNPTTSAHEAASHTNSTTSASAIAVVSILLYWVALFLSARYFRTKEERLQEQAYEEKCGDVSRLENGIAGKEKEIVETTANKNTEISVAFKKWEYALSIERMLINFAQEASEAYKQKNMRHRTDEVFPIFFSYKPQFNFNTFFTNVKAKQYEEA
jgi:hypothetical protein